MDIDAPLTASVAVMNSVIPDTTIHGADRDIRTSLRDLVRQAEGSKRAATQAGAETGVCRPTKPRW